MADLELKISVRVPAELAGQLAKATDRGKNRLAPTQTQVLLRGLELALREMEKK
jgi:hypothetical protein